MKRFDQVNVNGEYEVEGDGYYLVQGDQFVIEANGGDVARFFKKCMYEKTTITSMKFHGPDGSAASNETYSIINIDDNTITLMK